MPQRLGLQVQAVYLTDKLQARDFLYCQNLDFWKPLNQVSSLDEASSREPRHLVRWLHLKELHALSYSRNGISPSEKDEGLLHPLEAFTAVLYPWSNDRYRCIRLAEYQCPNSYTFSGVNRLLFLLSLFSCENRFEWNHILDIQNLQPIL